MRKSAIILSAAILLNGCESMPQADIDKCGDNPECWVKLSSDRYKERNADPNSLINVVGSVLAGVAIVAVTGAVIAASGPTHTTTTKFKRDANGNIGRIESTHYRSRIRYSPDGSIREIKTTWR